MKLRRITTKDSMIATSCKRPMMAAMPEYRSKRNAMYTSMSTAARVRLLMALLISSLPTTAPTRVMSTYSMSG